MSPTPAAVDNELCVDDDYFADLLGPMKDEAVEESQLDSALLNRQRCTEPLSTEPDGHVPSMVHMRWLHATLNSSAGTSSRGELDVQVPTTAFCSASLPTAYIPPPLSHTPAPCPAPITFHVPEIQGVVSDPSVVVPSISPFCQPVSQSLPAGLCTASQADGRPSPKVLDRRQRNRTAAKHARARKKLFIKALEEHNAELEHKVESLEQDLQALQRQNSVRVYYWC